MATEETSVTTQAIPDKTQKEEPKNKIIKVIKFLNGKKVIKRTCAGEGYRYDPVAKRCIKLTPQELKKMKIANKKRVRKMAKKMALIARKRKKSLAIRKARLGEN